MRPFVMRVRAPHYRIPVLPWLVTFIAGVFAGLAACAWLARPAHSIAAAASTAADLGLMTEASNTIAKYYVDRAAVQPRAITYGAIRGMVSALGDTGHSTFLSPSELRAARTVETGELQGVGLEVNMKDGHVVVVAPIDDSPAARAGLRPGDIILAVAGEPVAGRPLSEVVSKISGRAGTEVAMQILTPETGSARLVRLTRATIHVPGVTWQQLPGTELADLRVAAFSRGVAEQIKVALAQISQKHLRGIVLDLRDNPGGLLDAAVDVASQFLRAGDVVLVKNVHGDITRLETRAPAAAPDTPLVVLIDEGTASGAEVVAGALHDAGRAELIGEKTFGTGTVLQEFDLSDGSALLLAVDEWLTPLGHSIWHKGIQPDVPVHLPAHETPLWPEAVRTLTAQQLLETNDTQLSAAIERLRERATNVRSTKDRR
jgi:carboxyl-terminal processing protease